MQAELEKCGFKVSTDTRKSVAGSIYFALKGTTFDGNKFVHEAIEKGALGAVTDDSKIVGNNIFYVENVLKTLQAVAKEYRKSFTIPIIAIGGSNGKTTSKELIREVLNTKYTVHATAESLNNHIGVPLSILSMDKNSDIGLFEVGANHPQEHLELLDILDPTIVVITNNGLDHLEGFKSPLGVRKANKEIYDWALSNNREAFVNKDHQDLLEDSEGLERIFYPTYALEITGSMPLVIKLGGKEYTTNITGDYNVENIQLALSVGTHFEINPKQALEAISRYLPSSKRSQLVKINGINFIIDCYNANPTSMQLALTSFLQSAKHPRGVVLGDMLELGSYSGEEHKKVVDYVSKQNLDCTVFIGNDFKKVLEKNFFTYHWFPDPDKAKQWFKEQNFDGFTFLLKGSRGIKVEKILDP